MSSFLDKLDNATILEIIDLSLLFEVFLLKRNDSPYQFITISADLDQVIDYDRTLPRFIVKTSIVKEVKTFIGIPFQKIEGKLHKTVAKIETKDENQVEIAVFGHEDYDVLKRLVTAFISKHTEASVTLVLLEPTSEYCYPDYRVYNFWKLFKSIFIRTSTVIK
jgi:hypothetical protein